MEENGRWVTMNGARVFIKEGQSPMDAFIRRKTNSDDVAIHYGDLGIARDTTYFAINSSNRSTGHFGTGTYFISPDEDDKMQKSPFFSRKDRPKKVVNFNDYELYKPMIEPEARRLHDGLKAINYGKYDDFDVEIMSMDFKRKGVTQDKINDAINKVKLRYGKF